MLQAGMEREFWKVKKGQPGAPEAVLGTLPVRRAI
jgi:hypothetical protein